MGSDIFDFEDMLPVFLVFPNGRKVGFTILLYLKVLVPTGVTVRLFNY